MANSVSNDALWEKLLEISEQLKGSKQTDNTPDFNELKEEIFAKIQSEADILGKHGDSNYGAINENIATANKKIDKIGSIVAQIRKHQKEAAEIAETSKVTAELPQSELAESLSAPASSPTEEKTQYFDFKIFKIRIFRVRKTSVVITLLGLLVLTLTLFCMKQQNDYALLLDEFYRLILDNKPE